MPDIKSLVETRLVGYPATTVIRDYLVADPVEVEAVSWLAHTVFCNQHRRPSQMPPPHVMRHPIFANPVIKGVNQHTADSAQGPAWERAFSIRGAVYACMRADHEHFRAIYGWDF